MSKLKMQELGRKIEGKRAELKKIFDDSKTKEGEFDLKTDQLTDVNARNEELNTLADEFKQLKTLVEIEERNAAELESFKSGKGLVWPGSKDEEMLGSMGLVHGKSLGDRFTESDAFKGFKGGRSPLVEVDDISLKTVLSTSAGYAPQAIRSGLLVPSAQRQPRVVDVIPISETTQVAYVYMEETTFTNNAAEAAESGQYGEAALAYTERSSAVRKIAVFIPVTDEQMADVAGMRDLVNNRLELMVRQRLDSQIVSGDGTAPNLRGLVNVAGIQTQATGADPVPDAIYKAMTKIMTTAYADPDAVLMHPLDWQDIRLLRTADGIYIWGSPSEQGPARLWGLPVVTSTALTQNTAIVADFGGYTQLVYKAGLEFEVSNSHSDFFIKGQLAVRAQMRAAFVVTRPAAVCTVTGV